MIVTVRRQVFTNRHTVGQLSVGDIQCCTMELPMPVYHCVRGSAVPPGQYAMQLKDGFMQVIDIPRHPMFVIGLDVELGFGMHDHLLTGRESALAAVREKFVHAVGLHDDVMLEIINDR